MRGAPLFRGQPLLLLGGLLVVWLGLRVMLWQSPFKLPLDAGGLAVARSSFVSANPPEPRAAGPAQTAINGNPPPGLGPDNRIAPPKSLPPLRMDWPAKPVPTPLVPSVLPASSAHFEANLAPRPEAPAQVRRLSPRAVVGHNLLLAAGLSQMEIPPFLLAYLEQKPAPGVPAAAHLLTPPRDADARGGTARWSADGWLLLRTDTTTPIQAGVPTYGRSQSGAAVRYRLSANERRPLAHLRISGALTGPREQEIAAGVSARLVPQLPVRFVAEARAGHSGKADQVRPAIFAVSEIPPIELPLATRAEFYVQGGYAGGEQATAFADGQARIGRRLTRRGMHDIDVGAGAWGGAQEGTSRFDIGPTASVTFRLGRTSGRLAADYRFRVAGNAEPKSGPALTLSAGF